MTNKQTKVRIKHVEFVRDLGGLTNKDGYTIKSNYLYRTSKLTKIKNKQINKIQNSLNTRTIIDLRTENEVNYKPDIKVPNAKYINLPVLEDYDNPVIKPKNATKVLKSLMRKDGGVISYMSSIYRKLISSNQAITNYQLFFKELINSDEAVLWHCTQGKDRTGIASAILLLALGFDEETIIKDYLRYNKKHKIKRFFISLGVTVFFFSYKKAISLHNLLIARKEYIDAAIDEIKTKYRSFDNYLKNGLKLSNEDISLLRTKFLYQTSEE